MELQVNNNKKNEKKATMVNIDNDNRSKRCSLFFGDTPLGIKILQFIDGLPFSIFITIVTIITLFSDDIREIFFPPSADQKFSILTVICIVIYTTQMVLLSFLRDGYFLRFYFWMDLISTLSMLLDLVWINTLIVDGGIESATKVVKIARASRASKIGANSTKLIRIIRLIRILRLYKTARNQLNRQNKQKIQKKGGDNTPRKISKRLDRNKKVSSALGFPIVRSSGSAPIQGQKKQTNKHQVSFKDIAFQGSQRKLSVLHPSKNNIEKNQGQKNQSGKRIPSVALQHAGTFQEGRGKFIEHMLSDDNVLSEDGNKKQQNQNVQQIQVHAETKVGTKLKEQIQKNIVLMILCILISIPLLNSDTWFSNIKCYQKAVADLNNFANLSSNSFDSILPVFMKQMTQKPQPLVFFSLSFNQTCCQFPANFSEYVNSTKSLNNIRQMNIDVYSSDANNQYNITIAFDKSDQSIFSSQLNIGRTLFICVLMIIVTLLFTRDVQVQALQPLQNMIDTVKKISSNPLQAIKDIQKENMIKHVIQNKQVNPNASQQQLLMIAKQQKQNQTEPSLLQNMIVKIGSLLAVGFGQAGTELMARNIQNYGTLNVMMPGKKVMCIFGFCDIRNFTDATEVLESKVMVFVNQIAQICHQVVNRVGGNPNKNIGDAFLLVWKFSEDDTVTVQNRHQSFLELRSSLKVRQTADLSVYSFVKMIAEISRSQNLQKYKQNQGLKARIKNFQGVKMGFGLHVGWAIEGPIGSEFKIDASYLGSHVNVAGRLEAGTKHYGVPMLISGDLYNLMTLKNKQHLRQVDKVIMAAGQKPMQLYTVDLSVSNLLKANGVSKQNQINIFEKKKAKVFHNQKRDQLMRFIQKKRITSALWNDDKDIKAMREPFSSKFFYDEWKLGFEAYDKGNWQVARQVFKKTLVLGLNHHDGPSNALLQFMQETNFVAPQNWEKSARDYVA